MASLARLRCMLTTSIVFHYYCKVCATKALTRNHYSHLFAVRLHSVEVSDSCAVVFRLAMILDDHLSQHSNLTISGVSISGRKFESKDDRDN